MLKGFRDFILRGNVIDLAVAVVAEQVVFPGDGVDGPALSYSLQNDGTVRDNNTLLIWEVKDTGKGIHGVNRTFTWSISKSDAPDGTAFTEFLGTLNNKCDGDETTACTQHADCNDIGNGKCGYAGHRDWRLPNGKELQSIVDYNKSFPAIASSFPGATSEDAWGIDFIIGTVHNVDRFTSLRVRAVRGGR